jgi:hypothetical protein
VTSAKPGDRIEAMLHSLLFLGEQVVFKFEPGSGSAEACVLMSLERQPLTAQPRERGKIELVSLPVEAEQSAPVSEFTALGDVDYQKLLPKKSGNTEGQFDEVFPEESVLPPDELEEEVKGSTRVKGTTQKMFSDSTKITVSGSREHQLQSDGTQVRLAGGAAPKPKTQNKPRQSLLGSLAALFGLKPKKATSPVVQPVAPGVGDPAAEDLSQALTQDESLIDAQALEQADGSSPTLTPVFDGSAESAIAKEFEVTADTARFSKFVDRMEKEKPTIMAQAKNAKVERWIEGIAGELMTERVKLAEATRRVNQQARQREHEFKSRENRLLNEIRQRDEAMRSKSVQLMRLKDQVAKLQMSVERAKTGTSNMDEGSSKYKLGQTQRILQTVRTENDQLNTKMKEMRLRVEQLTEQRRMMVPNAVHSELQKKYEKMARQLEELKRLAPAAASAIKTDPSDSGDGSGGSKPQAA